MKKNTVRRTLLKKIIESRKLLERYNQSQREIALIIVMLELMREDEPNKLH